MDDLTPPPAGETESAPDALEDEARRSVGWRCRPCGWETFSLADMHNLVNWRNPDGSIALVCPRCGTEGDFVDAER